MAEHKLNRTKVKVSVSLNNHGKQNKETNKKTKNKTKYHFQLD